jgi:DNA excision repair protein ERCC-4
MSEFQESIPPVICPFTVVIDTREQFPFLFNEFRADSKYLRVRQGKRIIPALHIPTTTRTLSTGDYSIEGFESQIAIERKSLSDLYSTLASGRDRFERELLRLSEFRVAHIVVESDWVATIRNPPSRTKLNPKSVFRSINAWEQEFPTIHWQMMGTRSLAEHKTFRILERFWNNLQKDREQQPGLSLLPAIGEKVAESRMRAISSQAPPPALSPIQGEGDI